MIKFAALAAVALIVPAMPAAAKDGTWQVGSDQMHILDSRIDTTTAAGRVMLLAKVEAAARHLCRDKYDVTSDRDACVAETIRQTVAQPGQSRLALAYAERNAARLASR